MSRFLRYSELFESAKEFNDINKLATQIIHKYCEDNYELWGELIDQYVNHHFRLMSNAREYQKEIYPTFVKNDTYLIPKDVSISNLHQIKDYFEDVILTVNVSLDKFVPDVLGMYDNENDKLIRLYLSRRSIYHIDNCLTEHVKLALDGGFAQFTKPTLIDLMFECLGEIYIPTLAHELQHAMDDFKSKGKVFASKANDKYFDDMKSIHNKKTGAPLKNVSRKRQEEIFKEYLNLPHELWGHFAGAISEILQKTGGKLPELHDFIEYFKSHFANYNEFGKFISKDNQKRMLKAAYVYYDMQSKGEL